MFAKFGPAGTGDTFKEQGYKKSAQLPQYLKNAGVNAFEYQCGRGVNINEEAAALLGRDLKDAGIALSLHAPYFISLSSVEKEKRIGSVKYILQSAAAVKILGGTRVVVHSGSCAKISREEALELARDTLKMASAALDENGFSDVILCIETMGKVNQLGNLSEVMELCSVDDRFLPCIDFGHLNARDFGSIKSGDDYLYILDTIENKLGADKLKIFHSHFSKIEYTLDGGEKKHLTFEDKVFGPNYEPLLELIYKKNLAPTFICESAGSQTEDSAQMKRFYESLF